MLQLIGLIVRRRYQCDTAIEQCREQVTQNHGVRDVHYGEFVETNYPGVFGQAVGCLLQGDSRVVGTV